jgi:hypothetical protein
MREWIEEHPLLAGIGVLLFVVLLFVLLRRGGGSAQVIQTGPSENLQAAQLNAAVQLATLNYEANYRGSALAAAIAGKKIDAQTTLAVSGAQKDVALTGILADKATQIHQQDTTLQATQYATQGIVQQQTIISDAAIKQSGIQAEVINNQTRAALEAQGIISKATVDVASIGAQTDQAKIAAALAAIHDTNDANVRLGIDTNATVSNVAKLGSQTAVDLATLDATTKQLAINQGATVANNFIDTQAVVANHYIDTQGSLQSQKATIVSNLVSSGQINKGGEGGKNQAGLLETWLGNFQGGVANASQTPDTVGTTLAAGSSLFSNIAKGFFSFFG